MSQRKKKMHVVSFEALSSMNEKWNIELAYEIDAFLSEPRREYVDLKITRSGDFRLAFLVYRE